VPEDVQHTKKNAAYEWHNDQRKQQDRCRQYKLQDKDDKIDRTRGSVMTRPTQSRNNTRRRIIMALGDGMLAQALLDYFDQHDVAILYRTHGDTDTTHLKRCV
jgi:hypothetical protein